MRYEQKKTRYMMNKYEYMGVQNIIYKSDFKHEY